MSIEIKVPVLPESVSDATVATWHKRPGQPVRRDEHLVDIETDKVVLEVVAPEDGTLEAILSDTGTTVKGQQVIARFTAGAIAAAPAAQAAPAVAAPVAAAASAAATTMVKAGPAARRLINENPALEGAVVPSGRGGRIVPGDVVRAMSATGDRTEKRVPMSRLRSRIAERLVQAQQTAAILTTFNEVNMQPIMSLRARLKDDFEKRHGAKLGFMSFFTKAVVEALKRFPVVNASIDGQDIVYHAYHDIGVAVSSPRGLVVPVLRNVEKMSMSDIEINIAQFGQKAKDGALSLEEITGGTFTISNGGVFGSLMSTPILNPPQTAILGMHKIQERPVAENGQVVIRPMMYLALSYDHRIIDGSESVRFLVTVKELLEDPARLLLDV
ncbi:MAG: 2-oxoglutarate dehydrogenase complex dihydrolipoyllysine-residue succinyltransferase [Pseudomonadota bacterium]